MRTSWAAIRAMGVQQSRKVREDGSQADRMPLVALESIGFGG